MRLGALHIVILLISYFFIQVTIIKGNIIFGIIGSIVNIIYATAGVLYFIEMEEEE